MDFLQNLKNNSKAEVLKKDAIGGVVGGLLPIVIGTLFKLEGYTGWIVSYGGTMLAGKLFNRPEISIGAAAVGVAHLAWSKGTPTIQSIFNAPPWRMGTDASSTVSDCSTDSMMDALQPGAQITQLPAIGKSVVAYDAPAMSNSYAQLSNSYAALSDTVSVPTGRDSRFGFSMGMRKN